MNKLLILILLLLFSCEKRENKSNKYYYKIELISCKGKSRIIEGTNTDNRTLYIANYEYSQFDKNFLFDDVIHPNICDFIILEKKLIK